MYTVYTSKAIFTYKSSACLCIVMVITYIHTLTLSNGNDALNGNTSTTIIGQAMIPSHT